MKSYANYPSAVGRAKEKKAINDSLSIYLEDQTHPTLLVNPQKKVKKISTKRADIPSYQEIQTYRPQNLANNATSKPRKPTASCKSKSPVTVYSKSASTGRRGVSAYKISGKGPRSSSNDRIMATRNGYNKLGRARTPVARANTSPYYLHDSMDTLATPATTDITDITSGQNDKSEIEIGPSLSGHHEPRRTSRSTLKNDNKTIRANGLFHVPLPSQQPPNRSNSGYESVLSHRMYSPIAPNHSTMDSSVFRSSSQLGHHPKSTIKTDDIRERVRLQQNAAQALLRDYVFLVGYNPKCLSKSVLADGYQEAKEIGEGNLHGEELLKKEKKLLGNIIGDIVHLRSGRNSGTGPRLTIPSLYVDPNMTMSLTEHLPPIDEEDLQMDDVIGIRKDDKGLQGDATNMVDASVSTEMERMSCIHNEVVPMIDESTQHGSENPVISQIPPYHNHKSPGCLKPSQPSTLHIKMDSIDGPDDSESHGRTQISVITEPEVSETLSQNPALLIKPVTETNDPSTKDLHNILDKAVHNDALRQARRESRSARPPQTSSLYIKDDTPGRKHRVTASARTPTREKCDFAYHIPALSDYPVNRQDNNAPKTPNRRISDNINAHVIDKRQNPQIYEISDESSGISGIDGEINNRKSHAFVEALHQSRHNLSSGNRHIRSANANNEINTPVGMVRNCNVMSSPTAITTTLYSCSLCNEPLNNKSNTKNKMPRLSNDKFAEVKNDDSTNTICISCYPMFVNSVIHFPLKDEGNDNLSYDLPNVYNTTDIEDIPIDLIVPCHFSNNNPRAIINLEACKKCYYYDQTFASSQSRDVLEKMIDAFRSTIFYTKLGEGDNICYFNSNVSNPDDASDGQNIFGHGAAPTYNINTKEKVVTNDFDVLCINIHDKNSALHDINTAMQRWGIGAMSESQSKRIYPDLCRYACPFLTISRILYSRKIHREPSQPLRPYSMVSSYPDGVLMVTPIEYPPEEGLLRSTSLTYVPSHDNFHHSSDGRNGADFRVSVSDHIDQAHNKRKTQKIHQNIIDITHRYDYNIVRDRKEVPTQDEQTEATLKGISEATQTVKTDKLPHTSSNISIEDKINNKDIKRRVKEYLGSLDLKIPQCTSKDPTRCLCRICISVKETTKETKTKHH